MVALQLIGVDEMSEFEKGFAAGYIIGNGNSGGESSGNGASGAMFRDIIKNSEVIFTIPINSTYKLTFNFWVTDDPAMYDVYYWGQTLVNAAHTAGRNTYNYLYGARVVVLVAWRGSTPLYAQTMQVENYSRESYSTGSDYVQYLSETRTYIKGSAKANDNIQYDFAFGSQNTFNNEIEFTEYPTGECKYRVVKYSAEYTGSSIPTVSKTSDEIETETFNFTWSKSAYLFISNHYGTYTNFTRSELISAHEEIVSALYATKGMSYAPPQIIQPTA